MAIKKADDIVAGGNVQIPHGVYPLRVVTAKHGTSKAGNSQIALEAEILADKPIEVNGRKIQIGGRKVRYYLPLSEEKLFQVIGADCGSVHEKLGLPLEIDPETPDTQQYVGIIFDAIIDSKEKIAMVKDPTTGQYVPLKDPEGNEIKQGWEIINQLDGILRRSTYQGNQAY